MSSLDTLALVKDLIESPDDTAKRATEMLVEHEDPRIRLIAEMWARNRAEQAEAAHDVERTTPPEADTAVETTLVDTERLETLVEKLKNRLRSMAGDLRSERETVSLLTSAIGACHCLGEDPDCGVCHGRGVPAAFAPDPECFARYVLPVIRRIKERHRDTAASESRPDSPGRNDASPERSEK